MLLLGKVDGAEGTLICLLERGSFRYLCNSR
jgi:hypothetical protein